VHNLSENTHVRGEIYWELHLMKDLIFLDQLKDFVDEDFLACLLHFLFPNS
jgi:hypothetical protein